MDKLEQKLRERDNAHVIEQIKKLLDDANRSIAKATLLLATVKK